VTGQRSNQLNYVPTRQTPRLSVKLSWPTASRGNLIILTASAGSENSQRTLVEQLRGGLKMTVVI
jgi:hypothetical protein